MQDAEDLAIVRQVIRAVAAAIFCLLCGGVAGVFVVQDDYRSAPPDPQVQLIRATAG